MDTMIRSSKHYLKDTNQGKIDLLNSMFNDVKIVIEEYISMMLKGELPIKNQLSSTKLPSVNNICGGQWKQVCYAHASSIIRSNQKKTKNRIYKKYQKVYAYFKEKNRQVNFTNKKWKELNVNINKRMKFNLRNLSIHLDERLCNIQNGNSFDNFLQIKSPFIVDGKKQKRISINVPVKEHKHSLKYKDWNRVKTIRLSKNESGRLYVCFVYQKEIEYKISGKNIGFDVGYKKLLVDSNHNQYGKEMELMYERLSKKKRGSKKYNKLVIHKNNETNRIINTINFNDYLNVYVEDLKNVKYKSKFSNKFNNKLQYWVYSSVLGKLERLGEEEGFFVIKVDTAYTSQICSNCGVQDKTNRNGEIYSCKSCGNVIDSDVNGAINIHNRGVYSLSNNQNQFLDFS